MAWSNMIPKYITFATQKLLMMLETFDLINWITCVWYYTRFSWCFCTSYASCWWWWVYIYIYLYVYIYFISWIGMCIWYAHWHWWEIQQYIHFVCFYAAFKIVGAIICCQFVSFYHKVLLLYKEQLIINHHIVLT